MKQERRQDVDKHNISGSSKRQILASLLKELYPVTKKHNGTVLVNFDDGGIRNVEIKMVF